MRRAAIAWAWVGLFVGCAQSTPEHKASNSGDASVLEGGSDATAGSSGASGTGGTTPSEAGPWPESGTPDAEAGVGGTGGMGGAGATGGTSGSGGSGTGGTCNPQCAGRECGPDNCGSTCPPGCSTGQSCSVAGICEDVCSDTWQAPIADAVHAVAVDPGGRVYVAGDEGDNGWVGALSTCNGSLEASAVLSNTTATRISATSIAVAGADLFAMGYLESASDPRNGMWAKLAKSTLSVSFTQGLFGSADQDEVRDFVVTPSNNVWMVGVSHLPNAPHFWGIKGTTSGNACGFPVEASGQGRLAVSTGADVYFIGIVDQQMVVRRWV